MKPSKDKSDELEFRRRERQRRQKQKKEQKKKQRKKRIFYIIILIAILTLGTAAVLWGLNRLFFNRYVDLKQIQMPEWVQQEFITVNPYSRPGIEMSEVKGIVIHYVANPGTTARQNMNYFDSLKDQTGEKKISASSHFIIGLDGEVLQGIPIDEVAYATSKEKNVNTVSIECCHPDETGKFNEATYDSLVRFTAYLCNELRLTENDVIRHYDATGKDCPRYFVAHEDAWEEFLEDVKAARENKDQ